MNKLSLLRLALISTPLFLTGCGAGCRGGNDILAFFSKDPVGIEEFRLVKIETTRSLTVFEKTDQIIEFSRNLHGSFANYLDSTPPAGRATEREEIGKITVQKGDVKSCYKLYRSTSISDLFAIRVNDSSKGGGSILWFRRFQVSGIEVF